jgi:hypothetical protein
VIGGTSADQRIDGITAALAAWAGRVTPPHDGLQGWAGCDHPVYQLAVFELDGTPLGSAHFLRADLYHGETCAFTGEPFVFRAVIGYYECFNTY